MIFQPLSVYCFEKSRCPWLWVILFGWIYFACKGIWKHAILYFVLSFMLVLILTAMAPVAYPFFQIVFGLVYALFANDIVRSHYINKGWIEVRTIKSKVVYEPKEPTELTEKVK